jgi:hypothetical protein
MAQLSILKIPSTLYLHATYLPSPERAEYHNPIGIQMTRAGIARDAWVDK